MIPEQIQRAIQELSKLPGIGPRSAERLTYYLLKQSDDKSKNLAEALFNLKEGIVYCDKCSNISGQKVCKICDDLTRESKIICVVEEPMDVFALENTGAYKGMYHVLHGAISPLDGIGPEQLTINNLLERLDKDEVEEVILATNSTVIGEATSVYLSRLLKPRAIKVTHLAQGLPMGGELEFADPDTLKRALSGRNEW